MASIARSEESATRSSLPTPAELRLLIAYDHGTGRLYWRERPEEMFASGGRSACAAARSWNTKHAGKEAFTAKDGNGYSSGAVMRRTLYAHRVAWALHYGEWPDGHIDHINGDRRDNRIENLRVVSRVGNARNMKLSRRNKSGRIGVYYHARLKKWHALIKVVGEKVDLGFFGDFEEACAARAAAERKYGFHSNHGRTEQEGDDLRGHPV